MKRQKDGGNFTTGIGLDFRSEESPESEFFHHKQEVQKNPPPPEMDGKIEHEFVPAGLWDLDD